MTRQEIVTELVDIMRGLADDGLEMWNRIQEAGARLKTLKETIEAEGDVAAPVE